MWVDVFENTIDHVQIQNVPFLLEHATWVEVMDSTAPAIEDEPDPSSFPYIERTYSAPIPDNGNIGVNPRGGLFIPCADRIATIEDTQSPIANILDPAFPVHTQEPIGLNPIYTKIRIRYNAGSWITIFENGSGQNGWSGVVSINDYAGYERDLDHGNAGFDYALSGTMVADADVDVEVTMVDYGDKETVERYSFHTSNLSAIQVDRIFIVQELLIRVDFTGELAIIPELLDPTNYSITPTRPIGDVTITGVLPPDGTTTDKIFLQVLGLKLDQYYSLDIPGGVLRDREGRSLDTIQFTWRMRRTKMDVTVAGLPKLYDTRERTTVTGILEAIMISDEEIGGDY